MTNLLHTTFENIMAKGEIAHNEQFPLWPQCFQLFLMIKLSFIEIFHVFVNRIAELLYVGTCIENWVT